jgi:hypothetical protein
MDRVIGALTFKRQVYADVEKDASFTSTAWIIVAVVAFLNQLGTVAAGAVSGNGSLVTWLVTGLVGGVIGVAAFALGAFVIAWVGKALFKADVTFDELVRTLGLASVWNVVGVVGVLTAFVPLLACILFPLTCAAAIAGLVSWFIGAQEALDLDSGQTAITVILGWLCTFIAAGLVTAIVFGIFGLATGAASGLFDSLRNAIGQ